MRLEYLWNMIPRASSSPSNNDEHTEDDSNSLVVNSEDCIAYKQRSTYNENRPPLQIIL